VLDRIDGHRTDKHPENYCPVRVTVELDTQSFEAWTYVGREDARERCRLEHGDAPPSEEYVRAILERAVALGLPEAYLGEVRASISAATTGP
jgi:hypothetical protein